ncbi:MAG TPA: oxaloacetate decarboxylase [Tissierellia bacterium]|nr:oxaloacetate decarboxylase [Tissierellia bacterium]
MKLDINAFLETLPISLYGWLGVFLVIGIIYLVIVGLNKAFPGE